MLGIGFAPKEVGEHLVSVFKHGKHIPNSPFKIYVGEQELGNAKRVRAYGKGLEEGVANELNEFYVDSKDAGKWNKLYKRGFCKINMCCILLCFI